MLQLKSFKEEMKLLNGVIRFVGRTDRPNINDECKHPVILSKESQISRLTALSYHQKRGHAGRGMNLNSIPTCFWIINAYSVSLSIIHHCITCRSLCGRTGKQLNGSIIF